MKRPHPDRTRKPWHPVTKGRLKKMLRELHDECSVKDCGDHPSCAVLASMVMEILHHRRVKP